MKSRAASLISIILITSFLHADRCFSQSRSKPITSQEVFQHFDQLYKVDARLVSGDLYQTPVMSKATGHPFFFNSNWKIGSVVIDGIQFDSLQIRYDVYSNQLILNTIDITNSYLQVILKNEHIVSFTMDGHAFKPYPDKFLLDEISFCEVMVDGEIDLLFVQTKKLKVTAGGLADYTYQINKKRTLELNNQLIRYRGRRTLYKLFPELKPKLHEYIRQHKLAYRTIPLDEHVNLIAYCNSLL